MDIEICADSETLAERICVSLGRHGLECPRPKIWQSDTPPSDIGVLSGFQGSLFLGVSRFNSHHPELLRRLRASVAAETKLVVVALDADHSAVLSLVRAGASDILNAQDDLDQEVGSFLTRLSQEREATQGHVLTVVPCHAPSDASVLATNLAAAVASDAGLPCGLLDFHFRGADLALLLSLEPRHTIVDLFTQPGPIDEAMFLQAVTPHETGIHLLAGGASFGGAVNISISACQQIIDLAKSLWPVVVINSEDVLQTEQIRAIAVSDTVVITMRLDMVSLHRVQQHVDFLVQNQVPVDNIHLVALGTGHAGELPLAAVRKVLHAHHIHCLPDDPVALLTSVNIGNPVVIEHPQSKAALAIKRLAQKIFGDEGGKETSKAGSASNVLSLAAKMTSQLLPFVGR